MNRLKRLLGFVWIVMGPLAIYYLIHTAIGEIAKKPGTDAIIQWAVFITVFIPITLGLVIFGYFAVKGEYDVN